MWFTKILIKLTSRSAMFEIIFAILHCGSSKIGIMLMALFAEIKQTRHTLNSS